MSDSSLTYPDMYIHVPYISKGMVLAMALAPLVLAAGGLVVSRPGTCHNRGEQG